jgi:hypothetical protein
MVSAVVQYNFYMRFSYNSGAEDSSLLECYTMSYPRRLETLEEFLSDWLTGLA